MLDLEADSEARYQKFIAKILETDEIFCLYGKDPEGLFLCPANQYRDEEDNELGALPFWSDGAYPENWIKDWEDCNLEVISLTFEEFIGVMKTAEEQQHVIGIDWNQEGIGKEIPPKDFMLDLKKHIEAMS